VKKLALASATTLGAVAVVAAYNRSRIVEAVQDFAERHQPPPVPVQVQVPVTTQEPVVDTPPAFT